MTWEGRKIGLGMIGHPKPQVLPSSLQIIGEGTLILQELAGKQVITVCHYIIQHIYMHSKYCNTTWQ